MVVYECDKCNKTFSQKSHYIRHNKKRPCDTLTKIINNVIPVYENKVTNICIYCQHSFSTKTNLVVHMKKNCKEIKRQELIRHEIFIKLKNEQLLNEENKELRKKIKSMENEKLKGKLNKLTHDICIKNSHYTTNSHNTTHNTINNVVLIGYGKEDFAKISDKKIKQIFNKGYMSCVGLTDEIHFNPKYPEYHNVYISSMKDKYAMMYNGTEWKLVGKNELVDSIYDDKKDFIEENIRDFCESLTGSKKTAIFNWLKMDDDDDKIKEIKEEIKLLLYNKKHIPITTKTN
jgi:hypothetical protein